MADVFDGIEAVLDVDLFGVSADQRSIAYLREFRPPEGYYFANSYGKDSTVVRDLLMRSGLSFDAHHQFTGIDPPELTRFGRQHHPETIVERPDKSFWQHIEYYGLPFRGRRWCCEELKEIGGQGRVLVTGVRAEESSRRRSRGIVNVCRKPGNEKTMVNPIIDWTSVDVWEYIRRRELPYCSLYDDGWKRLGCVFCPFESKRAQTKARWPKMFAALLHNVRKAWPAWQRWPSWQGKTDEFRQSPEKFMEWWWDMPHGYERDGEEQEYFVFDQFGEDE